MAGCSSRVGKEPGLTLDDAQKLDSNCNLQASFPVCSWLELLYMNSYLLHQQADSSPGSCSKVHAGGREVSRKRVLLSKLFARAAKQELSRFFILQSPPSRNSGQAYFI